MSFPFALRRRNRSIRTRFSGRPRRSFQCRGVLGLRPRLRLPRAFLHHPVTLRLRCPRLRDIWGAALHPLRHPAVRPNVPQGRLVQEAFAEGARRRAPGLEGRGLIRGPAEEGVLEEGAGAVACGERRTARGGRVAARVNARIGAKAGGTRGIFDHVPEDEVDVRIEGGLAVIGREAGVLLIHAQNGLLELCGGLSMLEGLALVSREGARGL